MFVVQLELHGGALQHSRCPANLPVSPAARTRDEKIPAKLEMKCKQCGIRSIRKLCDSLIRRQRASLLKRDQARGLLYEIASDNPTDDAAKQRFEGLRTAALTGALAAVTTSSSGLSRSNGITAISCCRSDYENQGRRVFNVVLRPADAVTCPCCASHCNTEAKCIPLPSWDSTGQQFRLSRRCIGGAIGSEPCPSKGSPLYRLRHGRQTLIAAGWPSGWCRQLCAACLP